MSPCKIQAGKTPLCGPCYPKQAHIGPDPHAFLLTLFSSVLGEYLPFPQKDYRQIETNPSQAAKSDINMQGG